MVYGHSVRSKDTDSVEIWKYECLSTELTGVGARYAFASEKQALELCQLEKMRFTRSECKLLASSDLFLETYGCHCILWLKICFFFSRPNTSSPAWQFPELRPHEVFWQMPWVLTMGVHACRLADLSFLCRLGWAKGGSGSRSAQASLTATRPSPDNLTAAALSSSTVLSENTTPVHLGTAVANTHLDPTLFHPNRWRRHMWPVRNFWR